MNVENVTYLIDHLKSIDDSEYDQRRVTHECGTPACIAGHAAYLSGVKFINKNEIYIPEKFREKVKIISCGDDLFLGKNIYISLSICASIWLEISNDEFHLMFDGDPFESLPYSEDDPEDMGDCFYQFDTPSKENAINMLKNFLETEEVIWRRENEC